VTAAVLVLHDPAASYSTEPPVGAPLAEHELTAAWLLGRVPAAVFAPWVLVRAGRAGRGAGPDVREATFMLPTGTTLTGDVEVHLEASDWWRHGHAQDARYASVVAHLVWCDDRTDPGGSQPLPGGGQARTFAVAPACAGDPERLRALVRRGPTGAEPCAAAAAAVDPVVLTEALRKAGLERLAERTWRTAALVAERGWEAAWGVLLERALRASAGRRFESPAARVKLAGHITSVLGEEVMPALRGAAAAAKPRALISVLRADGALGEARAAEIGWNATLPLLAAYAAAYSDVALARATALLAAAWPAPRPYGRTQALAALLGANGSGGGALRAQGLLHTQELWCERGGCGVCPFSAASVAE
jgi:hypothetical protein